MDALRNLIEEQALESETLLIVGGPDSEGETTNCTCLDFADVPSFSHDGRFDLGVVVDPDPAHINVLSRLRDVLCRRVLLVLESDTWSRNELLALGFVERSGGGGASLFLHDLDLTNQPREWNNPSNWANPENFDKYRW